MQAIRLMHPSWVNDVDGGRLRTVFVTLIRVVIDPGVGLQRCLQTFESRVTDRSGFSAVPGGIGPARIVGEGDEAG
jgi:hypothetical protein